MLVLSILVSSFGAQAMLGDVAIGQTKGASFFLRPFRWTNKEAESRESGDQQPRPKEPQNTASAVNFEAAPDRRGSSPKIWDRQGPLPPKGTSLGSRPRPELRQVDQAVITDLPQQPLLFQPVAEHFDVVEWPPTQAETPLEVERPRQGFHPFSWSNQKQSSKSSLLTMAEPRGEKTPLVQQAGAFAQGGGRKSRGLNPLAWSNSAAPSNDWGNQKRKMFRGTNPLAWSNNPTGGQSPRPLEPPPEQTLSESIQQALQWQDQPDEAEKERLDASRPPADATDEQLVEWEKKKYPWIRPFYLAEDLSKPVGQGEGFGEGSQSSLARSPAPLMAQPFLWTNEQAARPSPQSKSGRAQTAAFFQGKEQLPIPPQQPLIPGQAKDPSSSEKLKLFDDEQDNFSEQSLGKSGEGEKGKIGEAETLGREPVDNSLQFLRADTVLLKPGKSQYDWGLTYSLFDQIVPVIVPTSPTTVSFELARFRRRAMVVPFEVRYGLARRIQLFLNVPVGWSNTEFTFSSFERFGNDGGVGDITFGGSFVLRQGDREKADAILTLATTAPSGQDPFAPSGASPLAPALGGGTWSMASSLLFVRNYDPIVVFYGVGTRQHFLRTVNGQKYRAGGEYNYQMGVGFAVNEKVTFSTRFNGAYISEARLNSQRLRGSVREPMVVGLAVTIVKPHNRLIEPFVDFGLTEDSNSARFGITWTR